MFGLTGTLNYYLCDGFTDMRCGIDGLSKLVRTKMRQDPTNGDVLSRMYYAHLIRDSAEY